MKINCIIPSTCAQRVIPYLKNCIASLRKSSATTQVDLLIFLITDSRGAKNPYKSKIDQFLYAGQKPGFSRMNNLAIEAAATYLSDYFLFINDDAWVEEDFLKQFKIFVKNKNPDIVAPLIFEGNKRVIDSFGVEYFTSGYAKNTTSFDIPTQLAPAACLFVKTSFLLKIKRVYGFCFNEVLYSYLDDVEFSIRARALGAKIEITKNLVAHHKVSLSSGRRSFFVMYQTYRNILWVIIMTWPLSSILKHVFSILLVQGWVVFYGLKIHGPSIHTKIIWETVLNLFNLLKLRKKILSSYPADFNFEELFSEYAFRTYHGITIKI